MLVYITTYDITRISGPSINERSFLKFLKNNYNDIKIFKYSNSNNKIFKVIYQNIFLFKTIVRLPKDCDIILRLDLFPYAMLMVRKEQRRFYVKTIGDGNYRELRKKRLGQLAYLLQKYVIRKLVNKLDGCDAVTACQSERFLKEFGIKPFIVQNGVDVDIFTPLRVQDSCIVVGYGGTNAQSRGGRQVIQIVRLLLRAGHCAKGVITGSTEKYQELFALANSLGVKDSIEFTGNVDYGIMPKVIGTFTIGVSMLTEEQRCASEQKLRQYFACGVPALMSPSDDNRYFEENGLGACCENVELLEVTELLSLTKLDRVKIIDFAHQNLSLEVINRQRMQNFDL